MKALSVKQPYAEFIATGEKSVELRTWQTGYRGPLLICSSASGVLTKPRGKAAKAQWEAEFPDGVSVCVVDLADIVPYPSRGEDPKIAEDFAVNSGEMSLCNMCGEEFDPKAFEYEGFAWLLENPRRVENPFPVKGKLNLFEVDFEI